jgi:sterol desaturase/sphingolipid hydroxylase (fatty acid hydroxylase superfamily)
MESDVISKLIPLVMLLVLGALESLGGLYFQDRRTINDWKIELVSLFTLPTLVQPGIFLLVFWVGKKWFLPYEDYYIDLHFGWQLLAFLILDDMTQYWWHRLSHVNRMMWKLHRPHHVVEEMGVMVTYRNAMLYYALMPGIWFSAILIFLGMGSTYLFYLPVKLVVILLAHSETKWDKFLYRYKILNPLAWVVERLISTPSTHFAHHGLTAEDGISHPNGNYGNLLFLWDVIFGTAKITRKYSSTFGAWNKMKEPWYVQLFFPILRSEKPESELYSLITKNDFDPSKEHKVFER